MKALVKYVLLFVCFGIGVALAILTIQDFTAAYTYSSDGMFAALFLLGVLLLFGILA